MDKQIQEPQKMETADPVENERAGSKRRIKNIPLLLVEICVLALAIGIMYVVVTATREVDRKAIDKEKITINEEVAQSIEEETNSPVQAKGYRNIALFGVDSRDGELGKGTRSDSIIIASINQDTQEIRLISVFRDTYLNLGNDSYNKCNAAYAHGKLLQRQ